uniref:Uncharacterized protein n=1 Tax=Arundo donax TaxID=35708 RepID=A0A0A9AS43_ARUDO
MDLVFSGAVGCLREFCYLKFGIQQLCSVACHLLISRPVASLDSRPMYVLPDFPSVGVSSFDVGSSFLFCLIKFVAQRFTDHI